MWKIFPMLGVFVTLQGCADLGLDMSEPEAPPSDLPPIVEATPSQSAEAAAPISLSPQQSEKSRPVITLPAGIPMTAKEGERIAARFRTLHQLAASGLIDPERYRQWAHANAGAFLLLTAPPPMAGLAATTPSFDQVENFLRDLKTERPHVADVERTALFDSLMPITGVRAEPRSLPASTDEMRKWMTLLDQISTEGLLPVEAMNEEKAALALVANP